MIVVALWLLLPPSSYHNRYPQSHHTQARPIGRRSCGKYTYVKIYIVDLHVRAQRNGRSCSVNKHQKHTQPSADTDLA